MIFSPWAMGLTIGTVVMVWLLFRAAWPSFILIFKKIPQNTPSYRYIEKQEILSNALVRLAFIYFLFSPILLTFSAFEFVRQIPGAMCPTGVFNANGFGFSFLFVRLIGIFPFISWMVLYSVDQQTPQTPFKSIRRPLIVVLFLWGLADTCLQTLFFLNLSDQIITSCCAVLFDPSKSGVQLSMSLFSRFPSRAVFFITAGMYIIIGGSGLFTGKKLLLWLYGLLSPAFFFLALAGIISNISPYIYALPHHHCPFCILSGKEALLGIPLTIMLYAGSLSGWGGWNRHIALKTAHIPEENNTWLMLSVVANLLFTGGSAAVLILYQLFGELL